jgi:hypothetical protein
VLHRRVGSGPQSADGAASWRQSVRTQRHPHYAELCVAESFGTLEKSTPLMAAMTSRFENGYYYPTEKPGFGVEISKSML